MPINETYNPANDPSINPLIRKGNDIIKRFVSPTSIVSGGGNGVTSLDDPTYLGFSLRFDIYSPLFNGATSGTPAKPPSETPLIDAISLDAVNFGLSQPIINEVDEQFRGGSLVSSGESAVGYLENLGEATRASYLKSFIQGLREVNTNRPYYWQTIDGLVDAWSKSLTMEDPYQGSAKGEGITIGCLEAIDLKISALFNLYKAAVYDSSYKRILLPKNLMYFKVYVDVYEIRRFKSTQSWLTKLSKNTTKNDVDEYLNDNTSNITFVFDQCMWIPGESGKVFENVTNAGGNEMSVTSMKWEYGSVSMQSNFSGYDQEISDLAKVQTGGALGNAVKNATKNQATIAVNAALDRIERAARSQVNSTILGNVFGLQNLAVSSIRNPGILSSALEGAAAQTFGNNNNTNGGLRLNENVIGNVTQPTRSLVANNIHGESTNEQSSLTPTNVFGLGPSGPPPLEPNNVFK